MKTQKVQIVQDSIGGKILIKTLPSDRTPASAEAAPEETADVVLTGNPEQASQTDEDEDRLTADSPQADEEPLPEGPAQADDESLPEGPAQADEGIEKENPPRNSSMPLLAFRDAKVIETAVPMPLPPLTLPEEIKTPLFQDENASDLQETDFPVLRDEDFLPNLQELHSTGIPAVLRRC